MQFHLGFQPVVSQHKITHQDGVLFFGSCFSEHIAGKLIDLKFYVKTNPFGIVFNPRSIVTSLYRVIHKKYFKEEDVFEKEGLWYSLEAHSSVYATSQKELLNSLNHLIDVWNQELYQASYLVITFGSAFAYQHKQQEKIVANCHKLPQALFEKILLENHEIIVDFQELIEEVKAVNPHLKWMFTVSPVKHLRDGVVENNLSKSILIQAVHQLVKQNTNCFYFPAYELVTDDLRDYRFYESDMAHPNTQAINYVWKKFSEVYFNDITNSINDRVKQIHQAYHHRLFNKTTETSMKFKHNFYQKCVTLQAEYNYLDLSKELHYFNTLED
ncbi:MAG: GSCFA domain-containing protein [Bacteroidia bacterium]